ncbi:MAG: phosphoadenosine phosphosulfate reductase domain-containing protein [Candidatus Heimdallarchaeaceae archaeon]
MAKRYLDSDVYSAAIKRLNFILDEFENIYLSFSGGKDSSVLLQLFLEIAEKRKRLPVNVLYIDFEAQYKATIKHIN